ncbi:MAG: winged helix-turn-helix transcriptional regulator [Myxococcales bacterium]|nr:winged helix-turn-helix transcriptional regulator [Myxococcales bacterium]MCB9580449.1 winged helix-turn-helix transcriptional regulator [Polyangiaceae bacterium]
MANGDAERLRQLVQTFVRRFGLLLGDQTPCGQPISVSHAHALMLLAASNGALSQSDLGQGLGVDKSNVARVCARMEKLGHARQTRAPDDGRSRLVKLTPAGRKLAASVQRSSRERFEKLLARIPKQKRKRVLEGLAALDEALSNPGSSS